MPELKCCSCGTSVDDLMGLQLSLIAIKPRKAPDRWECEICFSKRSTYEKSELRLKAREEYKGGK